MTWRDVKGYEGLYIINENGTIISIPRNRRNGKNGTYRQYGKTLKSRINPSGYKVLRLSKNGKTKQEFVHVLVAKAFILNPYDYKEVNHKDENKLNCHVSNLEWCNRRYNATYSLGKKVINLNTGKVYRSIASVADDGYCPNGVSDVCRGLNKTHKKEMWSYL